MWLCEETNMKEMDIEENLQDEEVLVFSMKRNNPRSVTVEANIIIYLKDGSYEATRKIRLRKQT